MYFQAIALIVSDTQEARQTSLSRGILKGLYALLLFRQLNKHTLCNRPALLSIYCYRMTLTALQTGIVQLRYLHPFASS